MTILTFPTVRLPATATLRLVGNTQSQTSPFDGSVQTFEYPGAKWRAVIGWASIPIADGRLLQSFVTNLRGQAGRFFYSHPQSWRQAATAIGSPVVNGAGQSGSVLAARGFVVNTAVMNPGDFLSFGDPSGRQRMHQVTQSVTTDNSGNASLPIAPPLRISPADGAGINLTSPTATWMLSANDSGDFSAEGAKPGRLVVSLDITEAVV